MNAIIVGATSGIGQELAKIMLANGWRLGLAGRRIEALEALKASAPEQIEIEQIDITSEDAPVKLQSLISKLGGIDLYFHASGIGLQNWDLDPSVELTTLQTNGLGFVRMVDTAFNYFKGIGGGHIAVISSIAGTKGIGAAPAYSATKSMQSNYIQALAQLSNMQKYGIRFTDIKPGFVDTALLKSGSYPLLMKPKNVAREIYGAVCRKQRVRIIDWRYRILVPLWRAIPRCIWELLYISNRKRITQG